jgi:hypothetical protein
VRKRLNTFPCRAGTRREVRGNRSRSPVQRSTFNGSSEPLGTETLHVAHAAAPSSELDRLSRLPERLHHACRKPSLRARSGLTAGSAYEDNSAHRSPSLAERRAGHALRQPRRSLARASLTAMSSAPTRKRWLPLLGASGRSVRQPRDARKGRVASVTVGRPRTSGIADRSRRGVIPTPDCSSSSQPGAGGYGFETLGPLGSTSGDGVVVWRLREPLALLRSIWCRTRPGGSSSLVRLSRRLHRRGRANLTVRLTSTKQAEIRS